MMMWIALGVVVYIAIACVTFLTIGRDNVFAGISAALAWPLLVVVAAVTAVISVVVSVIGYVFFAVKRCFKR